MADVWIITGTFSTPASGTTVIDVTSKGTNAKGIHCWGTINTSNDTNQIHAESWHGFSDGTNNRAAMHNSQQGAANQLRSSSITDCIHIIDPTDDSEHVAGNAAMNANDVTISYDTFTAGHIVHYMIFGGTDVEAVVGDIGADTSPHTGIGFTSDLILFATSGEQYPATSQFSFHAFGCAHDNGTSIDQWCLFGYMDDNASTVKGSILRQGENMGQIDLDYASWKTTITVIGSDGFTWTGTNADHFQFMCLDFSGAEVDIGILTKPTGAAPVTGAFPDLGFTPQAYLIASSADEDEIDGVQANCREMIGAYDGTTQHSSITTAEDGDNTDTHSRSHATEVFMISQDLDTNGVQALGTAQAITDSTPDIEWNPNTGESTIIGYFAVAVQDVTLTPDPTVADFTTGVPALVIGTVTLTPASTVANFTTGVPTLVVGGVITTPSAIAADFTTGVPTVVVGTVTLTPSPTAADFTTGVPTLVVGALTLTPDATVAAFTTGVPTLVVGAITLTPSATTANFTTGAPTLVIGTVTLTPSAVAANFTTGVPLLVIGTVTVNPDATSATFSLPAPTVFISIMPVPAYGMADFGDLGGGVANYITTVNPTLGG